MVAASPATGKRRERRRSFLEGHNLQGLEGTAQNSTEARDVLTQIENDMQEGLVTADDAPYVLDLETDSPQLARHAQEELNPDERELIETNEESSSDFHEEEENIDPILMMPKDQQQMWKLHVAASCADLKAELDPNREKKLPSPTMKLMKTTDAGAMGRMASDEGDDGQCQSNAVPKPKGKSPTGPKFNSSIMAKIEEHGNDAKILTARQKDALIGMYVRGSLAMEPDLVDVPGLVTLGSGTIAAVAEEGLTDSSNKHIVTEGRMSIVMPATGTSEEECVSGASDSSGGETPAIPKEGGAKFIPEHVLKVTKIGGKEMGLIVPKDNGNEKRGSVERFLDITEGASPKEVYFPKESLADANDEVLPPACAPEHRHGDFLSSSVSERDGKFTSKSSEKTTRGSKPPATAWNIQKSWKAVANWFGKKAPSQKS